MVSPDLVARFPANRSPPYRGGRVARSRGGPVQQRRVAVFVFLALAGCRRDTDLPPLASPDAFIAGRVLESDAQGAAPVAGVAITIRGSNVAANPAP